MKKVLIQLFILLNGFYSFGQNAKSIVSINHVESVATDGKYYFVADIGKELEPSKKDGDGKIFKIDVKTNKIDSLFNKVTLNSPKGIALRNNDLFIADIDRVVILNKNNGKLNSEISLIGLTLFLNDIAVANDSILYVSATDKNIIYKVNYQTKLVQELHLDRVLESPNGLYLDSKTNRLFANGFGSNNQPNGVVGYIDLSSGVFTILPNLNGYFDGIQLVNNTLYLSNWVSFDSKGIIITVDLNNPNNPKTISTPLLSGPADFTIYKGKIIIPQMLNGILLSVEL